MGWQGLDVVMGGCLPCNPRLHCTGTASDTHGLPPQPEIMNWSHERGAPGLAGFRALHNETSANGTPPHPARVPRCWGHRLQDASTGVAIAAATGLAAQSK